jgi:hypothetical protein
MKKAVRVGLERGAAAPRSLLCRICVEWRVGCAPAEERTPRLWMGGALGHPRAAYPAPGPAGVPRAFRAQKAEHYPLLSGGVAVKHSSKEERAVV